MSEAERRGLARDDRDAKMLAGIMLAFQLALLSTLLWLCELGVGHP